MAVLGGGRSSEHEVSLASAASIRAGLSQAGHEPVEIEVGRDGIWRSQGRELALDPGHGVAGAEVVFPALHGPFGEDGTVQGLLECLDVPYVGAGVLASALCLDKVTFKLLMAQAGVPQVAWRAARLERFRADAAAVLTQVGELGLPVFVKPARLGSSVGIVRVVSADELAPALEQAFVHDPLVIVEAAAAGIEAECAVLGNREPVVSEPGQIQLTAGPDGWYDYQAKYTPGGMELVVPAPVSPAVRDRIRALSAEVYRLVDCAGLARVDFFVVEDSTAEGRPQVLVNELNTMPGFTSTSVFPKLFAASGMPYPELLDRLVALAIERHDEARRHVY